MNINPFKKVSQSPTSPKAKKTTQKFSVEHLFEGSISTPTTQDIKSTENYGLDEKLRKAYFWIVNKAIISPFYDIEYNETNPQVYTLGDLNTKVVFPTSQSYSSFVLLPLLTLVTRKRCLLVGGPGRGKT
ncbi:MAG: ATPase, partial [Leptospiraceae bacterium]|nr:ATPase [Leptospiraceae bacterium]